VDIKEIWMRYLLVALFSAAFAVASTKAQAQSRATLCEEEQDPEQAFTYLQIAVDAGDRAGANACADRYMELAPRGAHVGEANALVASMRQRTEAPNLRNPPAATTPELSSPDATGWVLVGVGGAFLVAGGILLGVSASDAASVVNYPNTGSRWSDISDTYNRIPTLSGLGWTALALGAVGIGVGAIIQVFSNERSAPAIALRVSPFGVNLTGAF